MSAVIDPFSFLVVSLAGWMNQHQQHVIQYLIEENRVLREQFGHRRMRFNDDQRRPTRNPSEKAWPETAESGCNNRDSRDSVGMAPKTDRQEVR
jgi:hypothetical protein